MKKSLSKRAISNRFGRNCKGIPIGKIFVSSLEHDDNLPRYSEIFRVVGLYEVDKINIVESSIERYMVLSFRIR